MLRASISAATLRIVCRGSVADLRMTEDSYYEYQQAIDGNDKISVKRRTRLRRYFTEFVDNMDYRTRLGQDKFKKEGNFPTGHPGADIAVWEFKAFQWRLYGGVAEVDGRRCFVGVAVDPDKKQDRANQQLLAITARRLGNYTEFTPRTEGR
jgi:hypothetical protein